MKRAERRRGRPLVANYDGERCEGLTPMTEWKIANKREQRCIFVSKYRVSGHQFCRSHAVMEAMAICVERGIVTRIPRHPRTQDAHVATVALRAERKGTK